MQHKSMCLHGNIRFISALFLLKIVHTFKSPKCTPPRKPGQNNQTSHRVQRQPVENSAFSKDFPSATVCYSWKLHGLGSTFPTIASQTRTSFSRVLSAPPADSWSRCIKKCRQRENAIRNSMANQERLGLQKQKWSKKKKKGWDFMKHMKRRELLLGGKTFRPFSRFCLLLFL